MNGVKKSKKLLSSWKIESQGRKALGHVSEWIARQISGFVITIYMLCLPVSEGKVAVLGLPVFHHFSVNLCLGMLREVPFLW